jgi:hypothetical protein
MPDFIPALRSDYRDFIGRLGWKCIICQMPGYVHQANLEDASLIGETVFSVLCSRCGPYKCTQNVTTSPKWRDLNSTQIANISGYIRENSPWTIRSDQDIGFLIGLSTPAVADKAHKLLAAIARSQPVPGTCLELPRRNIDAQTAHFRSITNSYYPSDPNADSAALELFPALSFAWAQNELELQFLLLDYLIIGVEFLEWQAQPEDSPTLRFKISAKGWEHLQAAGISDNTTGFVAMWFDDSMLAAWEQGFYPGIREAGYAPLRIDKKDHNNKIDDEIIASIRGAKFVVADFTGGRGGVYFEAGFASGLGKPVIWCVRESDLPNLHFDTRQFNHITWSDDDLNGLKTKLRLRIEATIGRGSLP